MRPGSPRAAPGGDNTPRGPSPHRRGAGRHGTDDELALPGGGTLRHHCCCVSWCWVPWRRCCVWGARRDTGRSSVLVQDLGSLTSPTIGCASASRGCRGCPRSMRAGLRPHSPRAGEEDTVRLPVRLPRECRRDGQRFGGYPSTPFIAEACYEAGSGCSPQPRRCRSRASGPAGSRGCPPPREGTMPSGSLLRNHLIHKEPRPLVPWAVPVGDRPEAPDMDPQMGGGPHRNAAVRRVPLDLQDRRH